MTTRRASPCNCGCVATAGDAVHAIAAALAEDDLDRALDLGLLVAEPCPACADGCTATVLAARDSRRAALAARERFRARNQRIERRAAERAARRASPAAATSTTTAAPALPPAAADALARALAKAGRKH